MICDVCGHTDFHSAAVNKPFVVDDKLFLVKDIPAEVCDVCGEANYSADVAERIRQMVHGPHQPTRMIQAEVLQFHAA